MPKIWLPSVRRLVIAPSLPASRIVWFAAHGRIAAVLGADRAHAVRVDAAQRGERAADDDPAAVRRQHHRPDGAVVCASGFQLQKRAVGWR